MHGGRIDSVQDPTPVFNNEMGFYDKSASRRLRASTSLKRSQASGLAGVALGLGAKPVMSLFGSDGSATPSLPIGAIDSLPALVSGVIPIAMGAISAGFLLHKMYKMYVAFKKRGRLTPDAYNQLFFLTFLKTAINHIPAHRFAKILRHLNHIVGPDVESEPISLSCTQFYVWDIFHEKWVPQQFLLDHLKAHRQKAVEDGNVREQHTYEALRRIALSTRKIVYDRCTKKWIELRAPPHEKRGRFEFMKIEDVKSVYNVDATGYKYYMTDGENRVFEPLRNKRENEFRPLLPKCGKYTCLDVRLKSYNSDFRKFTFVKDDSSSDQFSNGDQVFLIGREMDMWDHGTSQIRLKKMYKIIKDRGDDDTTFQISHIDDMNNPNPQLSILDTETFKPLRIRVVKWKKDDSLFSECILRSFQRMLSDTGMKICQMPNRPAICEVRPSTKAESEDLETIKKLKRTVGETIKRVLEVEDMFFNIFVQRGDVEDDEFLSTLETGLRISKPAAEMILGAKSHLIARVGGMDRDAILQEMGQILPPVVHDKYNAIRDLSERVRKYKLHSNNPSHRRRRVDVDGDVDGDAGGVITVVVDTAQPLCQVEVGRDGSTFNIGIDIGDIDIGIHPPKIYFG